MNNGPCSRDTALQQTGQGAFTQAHNFSVDGSTFIEVHGDYYSVTHNHFPPGSDAVHQDEACNNSTGGIGTYLSRLLFQPPVPGANPAKYTFPLLAWAKTRTRRFDPVQLTLILRPGRFPDIKPIAWQVFMIDGRKPSFSVPLPLDLGFGDVKLEEDRDAIAGILHARIDQTSQFVPPGWITRVDFEDGVLSFSEPSDFSTRRPNHIAIENRTEIPLPFILGTYHGVRGEDEDERPFQPFAMAESVKEKLVVPYALNLQIYLTYNVRVGQVMTDDLLQIPLLRPVGGMKIANLGPGSVTTWTVKGEGSGEISLERQ